MEIKVIPLKDSEKKEKFKDESKLGFGKIFTDRMLLIKYEEKKGWHDPVIKPYEPFLLDPSVVVFHYAQEIFEGLKGYRWRDNSINLFRPEMNAKRFNQSADRICMPQIDEGLFIKGIKELLVLEKEWIPKSFGTSIYIRPTMIATEKFLGVKASNSYNFFIILSPVGAYYSAGFAPVKILVEDRYVRAAVGGTGNVKTGGNYAASLKAGKEAKVKGYDQVLWLDASKKKYIEEVGAMNIFFVHKDKILLTPPLTGSILPGVTRDSVIKLADEIGFKVSEDLLAIDDILGKIKKGEITEVFGSGTAAVISPVKELFYKNSSYIVGSGSVGKITQKLYDSLTGIQYGKIKDKFNWIKKVC